MVQEAAERWKKRRVEHLIEDKNQTMPDAARPAEELFREMRPVAVVAERGGNLLVETADQIRAALQKQSTLEVQVGTKFEDQFVAPYLSRIFPWALNFECGGPEYPDFQVADEEDDDELLAAGRRQKRLRRAAGAPFLTPQRHAKNLARRVEMLGIPSGRLTMGKCGMAGHLRHIFRAT